MSQGTPFTFGGTSSDVYGIFVKDIKRPWLPKTRERLLTIPTRDGQWDFGSFYDTSSITVTCWMFETYRGDLLAQLHALLAWLDPKLGARQLIFSDDPSYYWLAKYAGSFDPAVFVGLGEFDFPFILTDPLPHPV